MSLFVKRSFNYITSFSKFITGQWLCEDKAKYTSEKAFDRKAEKRYDYTTPQRGIWKKEKQTKEHIMQADKKQITRLIKTARGQVDGILKMVEEDRYCIDIVHQLMATEALLNKINKEILTAHLKVCVNEARTKEEKEEKIEELVSLMGRIMK